VSGLIKEVLVDYNDEVRVGQLLAVIDPDIAKQRVQQARADVDSVRTSLAAQLLQLERAQLDHFDLQRDHDRTRVLHGKGVASTVEVERMTQQLRNSGYGLRGLQSQIDMTKASVSQRESALAQAELDLGKTQVLSPVQGTVVKRLIERGQSVQASTQTPELFVIAKNMTEMRIESQVDEADVSKLVTGQAAQFTVEAYPQRVFEAKLLQIRKTPNNQGGVVTYLVVLSFDNAGGRLLPGMSVNLRMVTRRVADAVLVPNSALQFQLSKEWLKKMGADAVVDYSLNAKESAKESTKDSQNQQEPPMSQNLVTGAASRHKLSVLLPDGRVGLLPVQLGISNEQVTQVVLAPHLQKMLLSPGKHLIVGWQSERLQGAPAVP
jgi:HlyD family secretion protein